MKRILFIGNGFDLAHKLPTSYVDFLYVVQSFLGKSFDYPNTKTEKLEKAKDEFIEKYKDDKEKKSIIENNLWINYFVLKYKVIGKGWIDFENEIRNVCNYIITLESGKDVIIDKDINDYFIDKTTYTFLHKQMREDLGLLINVLDLYLNIVNIIEVNLYSEDVIQFMPTDVISFNYTNTYERIYKFSGNIDYVHGRISNGEKNESIVLGYNSFDDNNLDYLFADFIKYYQMVNNEVTVNIFDSIEKNETVLSMFFGHSLDETDADIIKEAIEKSSRVFIMCKDAPTKSSLIKKIIKLYGEREFRELCLSKKKRLFFILQKDMKEIDEYPRYFELLSQILDLTISYDDLVYFVNNIQQKVDLGIIGNLQLFCAIVDLFKNHLNTDWNQYSGFYTVIINRIIGGINDGFSKGNPICWNSYDEIKDVINKVRTENHI